MKHCLLLLTLLWGCVVAAQTPEEMYGEYITPETRAIMERFEQDERRIQEAEALAKGKRMLALAVAILIGLIPPITIGRRVIRGRTWEENRAGTVRALCIAFAGGAVLFGLNYAIFLMKMRMGDAFNTVFAFLLVAAIIFGAVYLLKK